MPLSFLTLGALGALAAVNVSSFSEVNANIVPHEVTRPGVTNTVWAYHPVDGGESIILSNEARLNPLPSASERYEERLNKKGVYNLARKARTRAIQQHLRGKVYTPTKGRWLPSGSFLDTSDDRWGEFQPPRIPGTNRAALREAIRTAPRELRMTAWAGGRSRSILRDIRATKAAKAAKRQQEAEAAKRQQEAAARAELESQGIRDLKKVASSLSIPRYGRMKKAELVEAILVKQTDIAAPLD